jgi:acyl carrier protein
MDTIGIGDRLIDDFLMDSLEFLEMAMMIEDIWGIALNASQLMQLVTVADVARVLPADARVPKVSPPAVS